MDHTEQASDKLWLDVEAVTRRFFDNELSPETAAQKLATIVLPSPPPDQDDDDDEDCTMAHVEGMWMHIIGMLEVTPERAQTACDLIVCMSQLPPVLTISGRQLCEENRRAWQDVPRLGWALRDEWSSKSAWLLSNHVKCLLNSHVARYDGQARRCRDPAFYGSELAHRTSYAP